MKKRKKWSLLPEQLPQLSKWALFRTFCVWHSHWCLMRFSKTRLLWLMSTPAFLELVSRSARSTPMMWLVSPWSNFSSSKELMISTCLSKTSTLIWIWRVRSSLPYSPRLKSQMLKFLVLMLSLTFHLRLFLMACAGNSALTAISKLRISTLRLNLSTSRKCTMLTSRL